MTRTQEILEKVRGVKNADRNQYLLDKSQGTLTSALIGGGLGFFIAYNRKWNLLIGTVVGATITGLIANFFVNKETKNETTS